MGVSFIHRRIGDYFSAQDWYNPISGKTDEEIVAEFNEFRKSKCGTAQQISIAYKVNLSK